MVDENIPDGWDAALPGDDQGGQAGGFGAWKWLDEASIRYPNTDGWAVPGVESGPSSESRHPIPSAALADAVECLQRGVEAITNIAANRFPNDDGWALLPVQSEVRRLSQRLEAARLAMLPIIDASDAWRADRGIAAGKFHTWLARQDTITSKDASREVATANTLTHRLNATCDKALAGKLSSAQVKILCAAANNDQRIAALAAPIANPQLAPGHETEPSAVTGVASSPGAGNEPADLTGEEYLLALAPTMTLPKFTRVVKHFEHVADPDADDRGYQQAEEREHLYLSPTLGGYDIKGFLTDEHGQLLRLAIDNLIDSKLNAEGDIAWQRKIRTDPQRRAQGLADLAQLATDTGLLGGGIIEKRQLVVLISFHELQAALNQTPIGTDQANLFPIPYHTASNTTASHGNANATVGDSNGPVNQIDASTFLDPTRQEATYLDGTGPISRTVLRRWACDSNIRRIIFGPDNQVLNVGRSQRIVPAHIRTAVIARDKHCVYPDCDQPPTRCEVHHAILHWAYGGETSVHNSALLCWNHHRVVDNQNITMHWQNQTGGWQLTHPNGNPIAN